MAIFPVNVDGIRYATAQLVAKRDGNVYLMQVSGVATTIAMQDGKTLKNLKPRGTSKPVYKNMFLLTRQEAERLFLEPQESLTTPEPLAVTKVREAGELRLIPIGVQKVAEDPQDEDFAQAAVYTIQLPQEHRGLMSIEYRGDVARLYADGRLVADNFYYGRPFLYGLWRLPTDVKTLELRILPLQADAPVYLPREADKTPGEQVMKVEIINAAP